MIDMFDAYDPEDGSPFFEDDDELPDAADMDPYTATRILITAEEARERGYTTIAERLDDRVETYLEPHYTTDQLNTASFRATDDRLEEEELNVLATSNIYMETLSSFTEDDGEVVRGTDIANDYIQAETHSEAEEHLDTFEQWLRDTVEACLEEEPVETPEKTYSPEEFTETAVETGLRSLVKMRRDGEQYPADGVTRP